MNTTYPANPQRRLLTIALVAAIAGTMPAHAQQSAAEAKAAEAAEVARVAEIRAVAASRAADEVQAVNSERFIEALRVAEVEQRAALEAVTAARAELLEQAEMRREELLQARETSRSVDEQRRLELQEAREVQRELERAHANLRRASQEVAQVHRELHVVDHSAAPIVQLGGTRAVIGVVLGANTPEGVQILAVSPDGPAERAGLQPGDVIISLMGEPLSADGINGRSVLTDAMQAVEPGDELVLVYRRGDATAEETLIAEERTPFSWQSVTRLVSAPAPPTPPGVTGGPGVPDAPRVPDVTIFGQSIDGPNVDSQELERELESLFSELQGQQYIFERIESGDAPLDAGDSYLSGHNRFSQAGDAALNSTNIWFGVPLTRGLKLAEMDSELGSYFGTGEGVLVLSAQADNALQLKSGDVIISVAGSAVQRPGDVMRALRKVDAGDVIILQIKRNGQDQTIDLEIPENRLGFLIGEALPGIDIQSWEFQIESQQENSQ